MDKSAVILVTGAAGFIGSCTVGYLNRRGYENIIIVDDFTGDEKRPNDFDKWALQQTKQPPFWSGLKFFNVYGPNEYHKGRMASVVFHSFNQISKTGRVRLFRSHNPAYKDGEQLRDFIFVDDVMNIMF